MVQTSLDMLAGWLRDVALVAKPGLYVLGAVALIVALVGVFDRDRVRLIFDLTVRSARPILVWVGVLIVLAGGFYTLLVVQAAAVQRLSDAQNAKTSQGVDEDSSVTVQAPPTASYAVLKTYRRTLTLPRAFAAQLNADSIGMLAPYIGVPESSDIKSLVDAFHRSGPDLVFSREQTIEVQEPMRLDSSILTVNLDNGGSLFGGGRGYFNATFDAKYLLQNPTDRHVDVQFNFPLPTGSGTLSNAAFRVDGRDVNVADLSSGYVWHGPVNPNARVAFEISYQNQGSRGWTYQLSGRREPIAALDLTLASNRAPKFARYSVFPTSSHYGFGGSATLHWQLHNIVTAQDIGVVFSGVDAGVSVAKFVTFLPFALLVATLFVGAYAWRTRQAIAPRDASTAIVACTLGLALAGVLTFYAPALVAGFVGCAAAVALSVRVLGRAFVRPLVLALLVPLAFLWATNTSIALVVLSLAALWLLVIAPTGGWKAHAA